MPAELLRRRPDIRRAEAAIAAAYARAGAVRPDRYPKFVITGQATRSYEQEVLAVFEETENAFVPRDRAEQRQRELRTGLEAAKRSVAMAKDLYIAGLGDFLAVLDAQRQQFQMERELAASRASVLLGTVRLYKAIGE